MRTRTLFIHAIVAILTVLSMLPLLAQPAQAEPNQRCFEETGYCISGAIRSYWESNGGLEVFGYPISIQYTETIEGSWTGPIQWFERDRLEDHSVQGLGVLAGRLGADLLEQQGRPWDTSFVRETAQNGCRFFPQTGFNLCGQFLRYWERNGGVERFGYPISPTMDEVIVLSRMSGRTWAGKVQYFERRRMESHPENEPAYQVLLGRLGSGLYDDPVSTCTTPMPIIWKTWKAYASDMGCPNLPYGQEGNIGISTQRFERGSMVWIPPTAGGVGTIFVLYNSPKAAPYTWRSFADFWTGSEAVNNGYPPAGLYAPVRGFGYLWQNNADVRNGLGWALEPERGDTGAIISFNEGGWMIHRASVDSIFLMKPNGLAWDEARLY